MLFSIEWAQNFTSYRYGKFCIFMLFLIIYVFHLCAVGLSLHDSLKITSGNTAGSV